MKQLIIEVDLELHNIPYVLGNIAGRISQGELHGTEPVKWELK